MFKWKIIKKKKRSFSRCSINQWLLMNIMLNYHFREKKRTI